MSNILISAKNLGKSYSLRHHHGERYTALRDVIANCVNSLFRRNERAPSSQLPDFNSSREDFWALKDVSFEIKRGEVVGIFSRNSDNRSRAVSAGKSTLLKIFSRITDPTEGSIRNPQFSIS